MRKRSESWGYLAWKIEGSRKKLIEAFQYLKGVYKKGGSRDFCRVCRDRTRGDGFKLKEGRFRLALRKKSFAVGVVKHQMRLSRETSIPGNIQGQVG